MESRGFIPDGELAQLLSAAGRKKAVKLLVDYFGAPGRPARFEGGHFERFAGGGDQAEVAFEFTAADVLAPTLLSAPIHAAAALRILDTERDAYADSVRSLGKPGLKFEELPRKVVASSDWSVRRAYSHLMRLPSTGETRATKLLARKRPHLVPILDSAVRKALGRPRGPVWSDLHAWLTADDLANAKHLRELGDDAGLQDISTIRIFDVLAWRVGSGKLRIPE